jgi:hypothetical protein
MNASVFFSRAAAMMQEGNAPATADASFVSDLAKIGIVPGKAFDFSKQSSRIQTQLNAAVVIGRKKVVYYNGKWRLICDFVFILYMRYMHVMQGSSNPSCHGIS